VKTRKSLTPTREKSPLALALSCCTVAVLLAGRSRVGTRVCVCVCVCSQAAKYARTSSEAVHGRRHGLGSSVGAVIQHEVEEEEEGYDPRKPAIGNVASVIKVSERR